MRYLVFTYPAYYPGGGWWDFVGTTNTIEEALQLVIEQRNECWHIVDLEIQEIVDTPADPHTGMPLR